MYAKLLRRGIFGNSPNDQQFNLPDILLKRCDYSECDKFVCSMMYYCLGRCNCSRRWHKSFGLKESKFFHQVSKQRPREIHGDVYMSGNDSEKETVDRMKGK